MFYYYGRKKKIAGRYPAPTHPLIIEPFAGSAAYSLHGDYWRNKVILIEKDPQIVDLWKWLISASPEEILALPDPVRGQTTTLLLHILHMASKRWHTYKSCTATPFMVQAWTASKKYMAANIHKIKHWEVLEGDYTKAPDEQATWFVDPPYQGEPGKGYLYSSSQIDYAHLGKWCLSRKGSLIVCEGPDADWLPFEPLEVVKGLAGKRHSEFCYTSGFPEAGVMFQDLW